MTPGFFAVYGDRIRVGVCERRCPALHPKGCMQIGIDPAVHRDSEATRAHGTKQYPCQAMGTHGSDPAFRGGQVPLQWGFRLLLPRLGRCTL